MHREKFNKTRWIFPQHNLQQITSPFSPNLRSSISSGSIPLRVIDFARDKIFIIRWICVCSWRFSNIHIYWFCVGRSSTLTARQKLKANCTVSEMTWCVSLVHDVDWSITIRFTTFSFPWPPIVSPLNQFLTMQNDRNNGTMEFIQLLHVERNNKRINNYSSFQKWRPMNISDSIIIISKSPEIITYIYCKYSNNTIKRLQICI